MICQTFLPLGHKILINRCKFGLKRGWFQCWFVFYFLCKTIFDQSSSCWRFSIISLSLFLFRTCRDSWYVRVKQGQRRSVHDKFQLVYAIALTSLLHQPLLPAVSPRPVARECSSDAPVPPDDWKPSSGNMALKAVRDATSRQPCGHYDLIGSGEETTSRKLKCLALSQIKRHFKLHSWITMQDFGSLPLYNTSCVLCVWEPLPAYTIMPIRR